MGRAHASGFIARIRELRDSVRRLLRPVPRVPTVLQMEAVECGAAALAMILAYHGRLVPLEDLRIECGVSRDGSKASNMLTAARRFGLEARGFRTEPEHLFGMDLPAIVHWNFNHFVVVEGTRKGGVRLNDPARGPVRVTADEFDEAFTGVALTFRPKSCFEPGGHSVGLLASLRPRLTGSGRGLAFVVLAGLGLVLPGILVPSLQRVFVDDVLVRGLVGWLRPLLIIMCLTAVVQTTLVWLRQHHLLRLETKLTIQMSSQFVWHVLRLPMRFFTQRHAGDLTNRIGINDKVATLLSGDLATNLLNAIVVAFYAALMLQYDVVLTLVSIGVVTLNLSILKYFALRRVDLNQRMLHDRGRVMGAAMGGLQTIETLKATGSESDFFARWAGHQAKFINSSQRLALTTQLVSTIPPLLLAINTALIMGIGGLRVMDGHLTMGMLVAFQALMLAFIIPVNVMVNLGGKLQEAEGDLKRLDDVLLAEPETCRAGEAPGADEGTNSDVGVNGVSVNAVTPAKLTGHLELRNVRFGYSPLDAPLIDGFSLELAPGQRVALVGASGSGKSTVARLVAGLYEPWEGEILFDGQRRDDIPRSVLDNSLGIVDQDIFLFQDTIRENLTLWDGTVSDADMHLAARDAVIHDEVTMRPGGYASELQEGGRNFSGGQRQRLEIARALATNPSILVLDEATSALDPATELTIDDNLRRRGCTCLLVAHRLSTIRDCDEIIVLDRGKIVQRGTHVAMCDRDGPYAQLIA